MRTRRVLVVLALFPVFAIGCGAVDKPRADAPASLRIERLTGSVARLGTSRGSRLYGVRLRARVCTGSSAEIYPDFTIAHYLLVGSPERRWVLVRKVFDRPPYLVPLQSRGRTSAVAPSKSTIRSRRITPEASSSSETHGAATASR